MKKLIIILSVLTFIIATPVIAFATDENNEQSQEVSELQGHLSKFPSVNLNIDSSSTYFFKTSCNINKQSNTSITGSITTSATQIVDKIGYVLYFQRLDGNRWTTIDIRSNYYNNKGNIKINEYKTVARNQTYRVHVRHTITHNSKTYYQTTISDSIYLN